MAVIILYLGLVGGFRLHSLMLVSIEILSITTIYRLYLEMQAFSITDSSGFHIHTRKHYKFHRSYRFHRWHHFHRNILLRYIPLRYIHHQVQVLVPLVIL